MEVKNIDVKQFARIFGIGRVKAYELVHSKGFYPAFNVGGKILINLNKLEKWLEEQKLTDKWKE